MKKVLKHKSFDLLQLLFTVYMLIYLTISVSELFSAEIVFNTENIGFFILMLLAIFTYMMSWQHKIFTGLLMLLWNVGVWILELNFEVTSGGFGIISGVPLIAMSVFYIIQGIEKRKKQVLIPVKKWKISILVLTGIYSVLYIIVIIRNLTGGLELDYSQVPGIYLLILIGIYIVGLGLFRKFEIAAGIIFLFWYTFYLIISLPHYEISDNGPWTIAGLFVALNALFLIKMGVDKIKKI